MERMRIRMILNRLNKELLDTGKLAARQYGFRKDRGNVEGIQRVLGLANEERSVLHAGRRQCLLVTLRGERLQHSAISVYRRGDERTHLNDTYDRDLEVIYI